MKEAKLDPAQYLRLLLRCARNGSKTFTFKDSSGNDKDVSAYGFVAQFKSRPGAIANKINLTELNGGVTRPASNKIKLVLTPTSSDVKPMEYYWQLNVTIPGALEKTWFAAPAIFTDGVADSDSEEVEIIISDDGDDVAVTLSDETEASYIAANRRTVSYVLALSDTDKLVEMNVAIANTVTVPPNSSVPFTIGAVILLSQYGAGATAVVAGAGVTIRSTNGALGLTGQYAGASLLKIGTNEWYLFGNII